MARETYVFDPVTCELVDRDTYYARKPAPKRSDLAAPMILSDNIEVKSMVDGNIYTSKAALRASYRARGYVVVSPDCDTFSKAVPNCQPAGSFTLG